MTILAAVLAEQGANQGSSPLAYGGSLRTFLDAEVDVTPNTNGASVTQWDDRDTGNAFTIPGSGTSPIYETTTQNGLPGLNFEEVPETNGDIRKKIAAAASVVDNHFSQGLATIAFAGRLNDATDSRFNTSNTLVSKGYPVSNGWRWVIEPNGTMRFEQRRSNGSTWSIRADGFYSPGDLVLATLSYNGGNTSNSGSFRLYNNSTSEFVTVGTITVGTASGIGDDAADQLVVGNIRDPNNGDTNAPFQGPIFAVWFTRPGVTFLDQAYMSRWIP